MPGIPKWIQEDPSKSKKKLIKAKSYDYLENLVLTKGSLGSTKDLLPEFIDFLGNTDDDFKNVRSSNIKTTYRCIEVIYN